MLSSQIRNSLVLCASFFPSEFGLAVDEAADVFGVVDDFWQRLVEA